jgi:hypothetical protein
MVARLGKQPSAGSYKDAIQVPKDRADTVFDAQINTNKGLILCIG